MGTRLALDSGGLGERAARRLAAAYAELEAVDRILEQVTAARSKLRLAFRELQALERGMAEDQSEGGREATRP